MEGRPVSPPRYRRREPFLTVRSEEPQTYGPECRVDKPRIRELCEAAKRRREIQVKPDHRILPQATPNDSIMNPQVALYKSEMVSTGLVQTAD